MKKSNTAKPRPDAIVARTESLLGRRCTPVVKYHLSTGCTLLDLAICPGMAGGRVSEWYGPSGRGKTLTLLGVASQALKMGGKVHWIDAEGRLSAGLCTLMKVDYESSNFFCYIPECLEDVLAGLHLDIAASIKEEKEIVKAGGRPTPTLFVVDSVAFLGSKEESEESLRPMLQSQLWTGFTRKNTLRQMMGSNVYLALINQLRDDVSFHSHGPKKDKTPGGNALKYACSLRVKVEDYSFMPSDKKQEVGANPLGMNISYLVTKNSGAPNFREAFMPFFYASGTDDTQALFDYILTKDVQKHFQPSFKWSGSWISHPDFEAKKYRRDWLNILGNNPVMVAALKEEVENIYVSMSLYEFGEA